MFILSNYNKKLPFKISEINNLTVIENSIDNLTFKAIESNSPVRFFVIKGNRDENRDPNRNENTIEKDQNRGYAKKFFLYRYNR